jgi:hypothetical protein
MTLKTILFIILALIIGFLLGYFIKSLTIPEPTITGNPIQEPSKEYSYTTAICNENKECIDVFIECSGGNVISLTPTSKLHEFDENWQDFRVPQERYCE